MLECEVLQQFQLGTRVTNGESLERDRRTKAVTTLAMHEEFAHDDQFDRRARCHAPGQRHRLLRIFSAQRDDVVIALNDLADRLGQDDVVLVQSSL